MITRQMGSRYTVIAVFAFFAATDAHAAVVGFDRDVDLAGGPFSVTLGRGAATYTFSDSGEVGDFFSRPLPAVRTEGSARLNFNPGILGGGVATYFTDPGRRPFVDGNQLGEFRPAPDFSTIDAQTVSYVALEFDLDDGTHYGFAKLSGLTLLEFAYEDVAGQGVGARPGPYGPLPNVAPVPLPAAAPMLSLALAGLFGLRRRRRAA